MVCMFQLWPRLCIFYLKEALLQRIHLCSLISVCPPHVRQLRQSSTFHSRIDFMVPTGTYDKTRCGSIH